MKLIAFYTIHAHDCPTLAYDGCPCDPPRAQVEVYLRDTSIPVGRALAMCIAMAGQQAKEISRSDT